MPWDEVMHKWKSGKLKSGGSGRKVTSRKEAVAIMLSEKRAAGRGKKEYKAKKAAKGQRNVTMYHKGRQVTRVVSKQG